MLSSTIAVNATKHINFGNNVFANYVNTFNRANVSNISYIINGTRTVSSLAGNVSAGDTVTAKFTVAAGKTVTLSLVSYTAAGPSGGDLQLQKVFDSQTKTFSAGKHALTVKVPNCSVPV